MRRFIACIASAACLVAGTSVPARADEVGPPYPYQSGMGNGATGVVSAYGVPGSSQSGAVGFNHAFSTSQQYTVTASFELARYRAGGGVRYCVRVVGAGEGCREAPSTFDGGQRRFVLQLHVTAATRRVEFELSPSGQGFGTARVSRITVTP